MISQTIGTDNVIPQIIIIGHSQTSGLLQNILNKSSLKNDYTLFGSEDIEKLARRNLELKVDTGDEIPCFIIVCDDPSVDVIGISELLAMSFSLSRQILVCNDKQTGLSIINWKNRSHAVDIFLLPEMADVIENKIKEHIGQYSVLKIMSDVIVNPTRFTPAYELNEENENIQYQYHGMLIAVDSIIKFSTLKAKHLKKYEILLGAYIMALDEKFSSFKEPSETIWAMSMGEYELHIKTERGATFIFFFQNLKDTHRYEVMKKIETIIERVFEEFGDNIIESVYVTDVDINRLESIQNQILTTTQIKDKDKIPRILDFLIIEPPDIIIEIINNLPSDVNFHVLAKKKYLKNWIGDNHLDILMYRTTEDTISQDLLFLQKLYADNPALRILLYVEGEISVETGLMIMRSLYIDTVLTDSHNRSDWIFYIDNLVALALIKEYNLNPKKSLDKTFCEKLIQSTFTEKGEYYSPFEPVLLSSLFVFLNEDLFYRETWEYKNEILHFIEENIMSMMESFLGLSAELKVDKSNYFVVHFYDYQLIHVKMSVFSFTLILKNVDDHNIQKVGQKINEYLKIVEDIFIHTLVFDDLLESYSMVSSLVMEMIFTLCTLSV